MFASVIIPPLPRGASDDLQSYKHKTHPTTFVLYTEVVVQCLSSVSLLQSKKAAVSYEVIIITFYGFVLLNLAIN